MSQKQTTQPLITLLNQEGDRHQTASWELSTLLTLAMQAAAKTTKQFMQKTPKPEKQAHRGNHLTSHPDLKRKRILKRCQDRLMPVRVDFHLRS